MRVLTLGSLLLFAACTVAPPQSTIVAAPPQATPPTTQNYRPLLSHCGQPTGPTVTDTPQSQAKTQQPRFLPCIVEAAAMLLSGHSPARPDVPVAGSNPVEPQSTRGVRH